MKNALRNSVAFIAMAAIAAACRSTPQSAPSPVAAPIGGRMLTGARQIIVVTTADWTTTKGELRRYERANDHAPWTAVGATIPIVVGKTGLAWGVGFDGQSRDEPIKHEGDGKSPAGIFPLDTAFGFAPTMTELKVPYFPLREPSDCVDDPTSVHYNTVLDRDRATKVDWNSAEHMRDIGQYKIGVIVGYNAGPTVKARGSCVFLHIWGKTGADSYTAGCTAMDESALHDVMIWLDAKKRPMLVQMTRDAYKRVKGDWALPEVR